MKWQKFVPFLKFFHKLFLLAGLLSFIYIADRKGWVPLGEYWAEFSQAQETICEHTISLAECPFCQPQLIDELGFCQGHGVAEALCTRCKPLLVEAFQAKGDWCAEHELPESQCTLCQPELLGQVSQGSSQQTLGEEEKKWHLVDQRRLQGRPSVACRKQERMVQFVSPVISQQVGIETVALQERELSQTVSCNARLMYDQQRYAKVASRFAGIVTRVNKQLGDRVKEGEVLAEIECLELGEMKAKYLQQRALVKLWLENARREQGLRKKGVATESEWLQAQTKLAEARVALARLREQLRVFGYDKQRMQGLVSKRDTSSRLEILAPLSGLVVKKMVVTGEVVEEQTPLFAVANTQRLWLMVDVYQDDWQHIALGQKLQFFPSHAPGIGYPGEISWLSSEIDPESRTWQVRAVVENPHGKLRANMFGTAVIEVFAEDKLLVVPKRAVQWEGCCNIVFVKRSDTLYEPRKVWLGYEGEDYAVVREGVEPQEQVVTQGSFLLKTEILKGSIGAGCCEDVGAAR